MQLLTFSKVFISSRTVVPLPVPIFKLIKPTLIHLIEKNIPYIFHEIELVKTSIFQLKKTDLFQNPKEQIIFLENIRFYKEEEENDTSFAKHLASLGDIYVNDAFSCSHRSHASVHKISEFLPSFSGLHLDLEVNALDKIISKM